MLYVRYNSLQMMAFLVLGLTASQVALSANIGQSTRAVLPILRSAIPDSSAKYPSARFTAHSLGKNAGVRGSALTSLEYQPTESYGPGKDCGTPDYFSSWQRLFHDAAYFKGADGWKGRPGCWEPAALPRTANGKALPHPISNTIVQVGGRAGAAVGTLIGDTCRIVLVNNHALYEPPEKASGRPSSQGVLSNNPPAVYVRSNGDFKDTSQQLKIRMTGPLAPKFKPAAFDGFSDEDYSYVVLEKPVPGCKGARLKALTGGELAKKPLENLKMFSYRRFHYPSTKQTTNEVWESKCGGFFPSSVNGGLKHKKNLFITARESASGESGSPVLEEVDGTIYMYGLLRGGGYENAEVEDGEVDFDKTKNISHGLLTTARMISEFEAIERTLRNEPI